MELATDTFQKFFVTFLLNDIKFAFPAESLQEISGKLSFYPFSFASCPAVSGTYLHPKHPIIAISLPKLLKLPPSSAKTGDLPSIIIQLPCDDSYLKIALMVDKVLGIRKFDLGALQAPFIPSKEVDLSFLSGITLVDDKLIFILEVKHLLTEKFLRTIAKLVKRS